MVVFAYQYDFSPLGLSKGPYGYAEMVGPWTEEDTVDDVVESLAVSADVHGKIDKLLIVAHGNAGVIWIGKGLGFWGAAKFEALKPYFQPHATIELHGCACASNTDVGWVYPHQGTVKFRGGKGFGFLARLSRKTGVAVTGAIDCQYWGSSAYEFQGRTLTVRPNGSYTLNDTDD